MLSLSDTDLTNLSFLLTLDSDEQWDAWAESVDDDDLDYALELLQMVSASKKNMFKSLDLLD